MNEHPNISAGRKRKHLVKLFGENGAYRLRKAVMYTADTAERVSKVLNRWLETNRYGTEYR